MSQVLHGSAIIGLVAAGYLAVVLAFQRRLLFPRPRGYLAFTPRTAEPVLLHPAAALYLAPTLPATGPAPLLIFTHGNGELIDDWVELFDEPRSWGWAVLLVEYPGYGRANGSPSERSIIAATLAGYDWARQDPRVDPARIVAYGRSLGGGPACRLAAERPVAGVILESAFTSVRPFAAQLLVPGFLVRDPFDNLAALAGYRGPLLVLHGEDDQIVPPSHGRALASAVPGATLVSLPCGHNDCPRPWREIGRFLHGLAPR